MRPKENPALLEHQGPPKETHLEGRIKRPAEYGRPLELEPNRNIQLLLRYLTHVETLHRAPFVRGSTVSSSNVSRPLTTDTCHAMMLRSSNVKDLQMHFCCSASSLHVRFYPRVPPQKVVSD